ncbi:DNA replication protein DnaD [Staphylococcus epidermidis FS1]|jgi:phage protein|uniref:DnaD domain protein n=1 Tax=Staphylococcus epidermidis TaxID=1282 RepID=UPI00073AF837|nr:DnaD domain protein [Staphylococcus epidermidis]DAO87780.1 MAG TPA: replisome organizer protein [Caudoviricetes sp.]KTF28337.1 DNA replication protein DnaD [Staphylococcus epidermidis FS1]MCO6268176.1 helix-turn-helix domain-containing protein [Staphylococcus epidermidis]MCO6352148.1 helix-turn-helix domain-containing protein [Staphylococcus epidermidis]TID09387.1 replication initiation and membrane attachment protein, DnaB/DnaD family [Staphylococcus epidermidis FS1]
MNDQPSYYSIITANVRYDNRLTDSEKLLFAEITSLSNKYGYCTASNNYFAKLYQVVKETISRRISKLQSLGYLKVELVKQGNEVKQRKIYPMTQSSIPIDAEINTPIDAKVKENNTRFNNTRINRDRDDVTNSFKYISNNLEMIQSPLKAQQLEEAIKDFKDNKLEIVTVATDYCKENNKGINYLIKVLENWSKDGVNTKEKAISKIKPRNNKEDDYLAKKKQEILGG